MAGPSSPGSHSNIILGCDPSAPLRERGGHTLFQNYSVRFRWLVQVVRVHILISFWGVTPSAHFREREGVTPSFLYKEDTPLLFQKLHRKHQWNQSAHLKDFVPLVFFRRRSLNKVCSCFKPGGASYFCTIFLSLVSFLTEYWLSKFLDFFVPNPPPHLPLS